MSLRYYMFLLLARGPKYTKNSFEQNWILSFIDNHVCNEVMQKKCKIALLLCDIFSSSLRVSLSLFYIMPEAVLS